MIRRTIYKFYKRTKQGITSKIQYWRLLDLIRINRELRNVAKTETCFVIGNGPSLNKHDLSALVGCKIVMNSFYLHPKIKDINPDYYIFADPESVNHSKEHVQTWWKEIAESTKDLQTEFILPSGLYDTKVTKEFLSTRKIYFVYFDGQLDLEKVNRFDLTRQIPFVQNTLAEGILVAMYMGYRRIVLLGADHDWLSHWNVDTHFYSGTSKSAIGEDVKMPYHWWLNAVNTMFQQYVIINQVAKSKKVEIVNCSEAGVLDVFPMVPLHLYLNNRAIS